MKPLTICASCRGLGCSDCGSSSLSASIAAQVCACSTTWASPTPRPICSEHGVSPRVIAFDLDAYFDEFKRANPAPEVM